VGAPDVIPIGETSGDDGGCWLESKEIARDFAEMPGSSRIDYNWRGGGIHFGIDNLANIVYVINLIRMYCRPSCSLLPSLKSRDKIVGVASHCGRGGCVCLVTVSWVVACSTRVTTVDGVTMGPAVATWAFD
jgi:hypothetical protein